uniref:B30.2/SPRY domain-containing protein n=1 Tax=Monopterus albus TaxID=43700 RepID=A0A3Q3J9R5_MONAL
MAMFVLVLLLLCPLHLDPLTSALFLLFSALDQKNITAKPGENITLPCRAPSSTNITVVEWIRPDLRPEYVFLYRSMQDDPDNQHESFKERVELEDSEMKDGNVSLVLRNVTTGDRGTYECHIVQGKTNRSNNEPISTIYLDVKLGECECKHKLIHPVENLESRICKTHDEPLEFFCGVDHMFICGSCKDSDHKSHKTVTVEEEAQMKRTQLGIDMNDTDQMIRVRQQKIQEIQDSVEASRNNAAKALSYSMPVMTAVVEYIKKSQAELTEVIETKKKKIETEAEGFIKELEEEIMQIKQKNLQEISMLCDPDLKKMEQHAVDVTLDPDTANPWLIVSEDGKQVTHGDRKRNLPNKPERFDHVLNVLAKEGFSSGKFYYEVQVKEKTHWDLGVAKESINRKGDIRLSPQNGYWTILLKKGYGFTANAGPAINLHVREMPQKIGVFVDYEEGQVSFYNVDSRAKIFSFTGCNFTEKLFPFFSPCQDDLVICKLKVTEKNLKLELQRVKYHQ